MKVRRNHVNWIHYLYRVGDEKMFLYFFRLICTLRRGKSMSSNRAAYYTLKHWYSTTTIAQLVEKIDQKGAVR